MNRRHLDELMQRFHEVYSSNPSVDLMNKLKFSRSMVEYLTEELVMEEEKFALNHDLVVAVILILQTFDLYESREVWVYERNSTYSEEMICQRAELESVRLKCSEMRKAAYLLQYNVKHLVKVLEQVRLDSQKYRNYADQIIVDEEERNRMLIDIHGANALLSISLDLKSVIESHINDVESDIQSIEKCLEFLEC